MTNLYSEWRAFYTEKVRSRMSLEELRAECGKLLTVDNPSPELLLIHAMIVLEERDQRDEALLRQALEALECGAWDTLRGRNAAFAIRERLGLAQENE